MHICRTQSLTNLHNHSGFDAWRVLLGDAFFKMLLGRLPHSLEKMKRGMRRQVAPELFGYSAVFQEIDGGTRRSASCSLFSDGAAARDTHIFVCQVHLLCMMMVCQTFTRAGVHTLTVPVAGNQVLWKMHCWSHYLRGRCWVSCDVLRDTMTRARSHCVDFHHIENKTCRMDIAASLHSVNTKVARTHRCGACRKIAEAAHAARALHSVR